MSAALASTTAVAGLKTIALVDFQMGGHHLGWLACIAENLLRLGHQVVCLCPDPARVEREIAERAPESIGSFSSLALREPAYPNGRWLRVKIFAELFSRWRHVASIIATKMSRPPDLVCFAMLDDMMATGLTPGLVDAVFPHRWTGVYFHPRHERLGPGRRYRPPFVRNDYCLRSPNCTAVAILDEGVAEQVRRFVAPKEVLVFPDFIVPTPPNGKKPAWIEQVRARAGHRTIVGCLGLLNRRKGIFTLLRVALDKKASDFFFLFAGKFYADDLSEEDQRMWDSAVAHPPDHCFFHLERTSDAEFDELVESCDLLYAAYQRFPHSSNLLGKAAQFSKPIVVSKGYCMEERVQRYSLGVAVREDDPAESLAALQTLKTRINSPDYQPGEGFASYRQEHSPQRLQQSLGQLSIL